MLDSHKKVGTITMVLAVILAIASIVISENKCYADSVFMESTLQWLLMCLQINLREDTSGVLPASHLYIQTKYFLLTCATLFAIGGLWHKNVLPIPANLKRFFSQN